MNRPRIAHTPASPTPHDISTSAHNTNSDHNAPISPRMITHCTSNGRHTAPTTPSRSRHPLSAITSGGSSIPTSTVAPRYDPIDAPA